MLKREEKVLYDLMDKWNTPGAMSYSATADFDEGVDIGRENCADELLYELEKLMRITENGKLK